MPALRRSSAALVTALAVLASIAGACSSDTGTSGSSPPKQATATTLDKTDDPAYEGWGPNEVGTTTFALADGRRVVAWYPAAASAKQAPDETFDIASLLSPALQAKIPADKRPQYDIAAHPGAAPADGGPYPLVLFSHGYAGFPEQSADLVTHLASWGFVVVAPDHVERSLDGLLGAAAKSVAKSTDERVLQATLDQTVTESQRQGSPLHRLVDAGKVSVLGHSAGASAAYQLAGTDKRIRSFIAYSIGFGDDDGTTTTSPPPVPKVPGLVMRGSADGIIAPARSKQVYDGMQTPKELATFGGAGHLVFTDICLIGKDQGGLVSLVNQTGLPIPASMLRLADDGCGANALSPSDAFGAIDHLSVAFLRWTLGIDEEPVGLGPGVAKAFPKAHLTLGSDGVG